jgi:hypothetical protein
MVRNRAAVATLTQDRPVHGVSRRIRRVQTGRSIARLPEFPHDRECGNRHDCHPDRHLAKIQEHSEKYFGMFVEGHVLLLVHGVVDCMI